MEGKGWGREGNKKPLNAPHIMLLLPATLINERYSPEHEEFHACASILDPLTNWLQTLLVVYLVKLRLTSFTHRQPASITWRTLTFLNECDHFWMNVIIAFLALLKKQRESLRNSILVQCSTSCAIGPTGSRSLCGSYRAVFKWLSKNQNQSNYSDQSQQEQAARWTNHNS